ncbi:MAG: 2'-5' RNA ligase [Gammaproteobacteria bacterium]|nr:MAG: 2'-5' RNA ligase [Gammaproteobacteria bacterium]TND06676.1 MAG: 2'-5' RNA ligase [Gammaproteobacteria bacterium]
MQNGNDRQRLFFALCPTEAARGELLAIARREIPAAAGTLVESANLHITLTFLGDLAPAQRRCVAQFAAGIRGETIALTVDRIGYWCGPGVVWAGASQSPGSLPRLVEQLRAGVSECGIDIDPRPFELHLTLVRKTSQPVQPRVLREPLSLSFDRFCLMASYHASGGVRYEAVESWPLPSTESA